MAVALDAKSSFSASKNGVLSYTDNTFTVGSGANRALVVAICAESTTAQTAPTVTWDTTNSSQPMTVISSLSAAHTHSLTMFLYGLTAPTAGNRTLTVSGLSSSTDSIFAYISFTGANQTGGVTTFKNSTSFSTAGVTTLTASIATVISDGVVAIFGGNDGTPTTNNSTWSPSALTTFGTDNYVANFFIATGTTTDMTLTQGSAAEASVVAAAIAQAAAAGQTEDMWHQSWSLVGRRVSIIGAG